ncbi:hypothetical protein SHO565_12350 [Streptomyces sp. HO565]
MRCNIRNDGFALHNTLEVMDYMNMSTRGLNHFVTREGARRPPDMRKPPERARARSGGLGRPDGRGCYFLSPPLPWSPPALMDS